MAKSNFKLGISNCTITRNDRPRRQREGVAILMGNSINFGITDTCSSFNTDNDAIIIVLK